MSVKADRAEAARLEWARKLARWRLDPVLFIVDVYRDAETGLPFVLYPEQEAFLRELLTPGPDGRLRYIEALLGMIKESGKTTMAAWAVLYVIICLAGPFGEAFCIANDLEQAQGRVFQAIVRIIEASPLLRGIAKITANQIRFASTGATITAIASDYASAAGANPNITVFDELWAYTSERSRRLWDEMVPVPTRKVSLCLTVTYAGFEGESELLAGLYKRGLQGEQIGPSLYRQPGFLMSWHHSPTAPWQTPEWLTEMRATLRPNAYLRMIENRWVSGENPFIELKHWDACVNPSLRPSVSDRYLETWVGVDASVKHDLTGLAMVTYDRRYEAVRLVAHAIFQPSPDQPLDFEATVERSLREWSRRFDVSGIFFDPYQMASTAQRLKRAGLPMREYPQSIPNLSAATVNLFELVRDQRLMVYPSDDLRTAIARTTVVESSRGMKLAKEKSSHKIDIVVALSMACLAAIEGKATGRAVVCDLATGKPRARRYRPDPEPFDFRGAHFATINPSELPE